MTTPSPSPADRIAEPMSVEELAVIRCADKMDQPTEAGRRSPAVRDRGRLLAEVDRLNALVEELTAQLDAQPDVDGWVIHTGLREGVTVAHYPTGASLSGNDLPLGAVMAFIADQAPERVITADTLCPCGKVNDGTGSGYCSFEHFEEYDGGASDVH